MLYQSEQRVISAESAEPGIFGMVNTILQRLHEQRDTHVVTIRSAKLSINVLLAHWHHVWTTDTVIVVSSYSKILVSFLLPIILSFQEKGIACWHVDTFHGMLDWISDHINMICNFDKHTLLHKFALWNLWLALITLLFSSLAHTVYARAGRT